MSYRVYTSKTDRDQNRHWKPRLAENVSAGTSMSRSSWYAGADLARIRDIADDQGWDALSKDDEAVWGCSFLLRVEPGDYLVEINRAWASDVGLGLAFPAPDPRGGTDG